MTTVLARGPHAHMYDRGEVEVVHLDGHREGPVTVLAPNVEAWCPVCLQGVTEFTTYERATGPAQVGPFSFAEPHEAVGHRLRPCGCSVARIAWVVNRRFHPPCGSIPFAPLHIPRLRQGRRVARHLYIQRGPEPSDDDEPVFTAPTDELAAQIVDGLAALAYLNLNPPREIQ